MESKNQEELILEYLNESSDSQRRVKLKTELLKLGISEAELIQF